MDTERVQNETSAKIAGLNDAFRKANPAMYTLTEGVFRTPETLGVIEAVRRFDDFNEDNDPYGEHDFGSFDWWTGDKIFWKIDYCDDALQNWCDPLDPECRRVLTVMLAEEY